MNFILISDIHATAQTPVARKDNVLQTFIGKITFLFSLAKKRNAVILQAGDFFDKPRDWNLLLHLINLVKTFNPKIYTIYGQHDTYLRSNINQNATTLGVLNQTGYLHLLSKKPTVIGGVHVYGASWGQEIPEPEGKCKILVVHAPISMSELYPDHKYIGAKYFAKKHKGYNLILAGDIHRKFFHSTLSTTIVNTGPMLRLEGTKYNMKHRPCGYIYNSDYQTVDKFQIPHDDSDTVLSRSHIESKEFNESVLENFMTSLEKTKIIAEHSTVNQRLIDFITKNDIPKSIQKIIQEAMIDES